jgi:RHS repeat-associated protein
LRFGIDFFVFLKKPNANLLGCKKSTYQPCLEIRKNTQNKELTSKISSETLRSNPPYGESFIDQRFNYSSRYTFSAKEKDDETQYSYFGARYYDSDLSVWLSVDPLSDKYLSMSPYIYVAGNPIMLRDPDGRWVPDVDENGNITLTKEKGDNRKSLYEFFGMEDGMFSKKEVRQMYRERNRKTGVVTLPETSFSKATKKAISDGRPTGDQYNSNPEKYKRILNRLGRDYNCWGSALATARGEELQGNGPGRGVGVNEGAEYDKFLLYSTTPVDKEDAVFGKTIIRYAPGGNSELYSTSHGSIYFGRDRAGNDYTFTKNGWWVAPTISRIKDVESIEGYGPVTPLRGNGTSGFYNPVK